MAQGTINSRPILGYQSEEEQTDYLVGAIAHLEAITARKLDQMQARSWMEKLKKYPKWKVTELGDYSGPMNHKVFEYLDAIQPKIEDPYTETGYNRGYRLLPENPESLAPERLQMARDFSNHVTTITNWSGTREDRLKWEMQSFKELDKKYPHLSIWEKVKNENRFQSIS